MVAAGRRAATAERITLCAQRLTDERGLDGFTMDDLAAAAEVSRRTLFNYFPSKVDAVLGPVLDLAPADVARFRAGGPEGDLVQDLRALVLPVIVDQVADREAAARSHRILRSEPRLIARVHAYYEDISAVVVSHIVAREDATFDSRRARVAVALLAGVFDAALEEFLVDPRRRDFVHHFDETLLTARSLLGS